MTDHIHPEERRPRAAYLNEGRRKQPANPRLTALAKQATAVQKRQRLRELACFRDDREEDVEGLMATLFGPEKRS